MSNQIPKASFRQIVQHPVTYMLLVAVSLMWFFVYKFGVSADQVNENCEAEKAQLRVELATERAKNDNLVNAILVKNGIIDAIVKKTDSTYREKVGNEAKKIVSHTK